MSPTIFTRATITTRIIITTAIIRTAIIGIPTITTMVEERPVKERPLLRSSPRKRGPRAVSNGRDSAPSDHHALSSAALYRLLIWLSPAYPVGAFSYSSGIEWAVESGDITGTDSLRRWLETMLTMGSGINDGILFAQTHRAVTLADDEGLVRIAELAAALVPSRERQLETTTLGRAFVDVTQAAWPCPALARLQQLWQGPVAYPIAVGAATAGHAIPLEPAMLAFLTAVVANWISAGVRLIPLGHTDSQRLLQAIEPAIAATAQRALAATRDNLGSATFRADLAGIKHETQYTRLFRS